MFGLVIKCVFAGSFVGENLIRAKMFCFNIPVFLVVSFTYWCGYNFSDEAKNKAGKNKKVNRV